MAMVVDMRNSAPVVVVVIPGARGAEIWNDGYLAQTMFESNEKTRAEPLVLTPLAVKQKLTPLPRTSMNRAVVVARGPNPYCSNGPPGPLVE